MSLEKRKSCRIVVAGVSFTGMVWSNGALPRQSMGGSFGILAGWSNGSERAHSQGSPACAKKSSGGTMARIWGIQDVFMIRG